MGGRQDDGPRDLVRSVAIGSDHGAVAQKDMLARYLGTLGYRVVDIGCHGDAKVDYPDIAVAVCRKVVSGDCERGIVLDGAGIGSCMAANKVPGVRAAACWNAAAARNSREHNFANVLTLGGKMLSVEQAREILHAWLATPWGAERHARRVRLIREIEKKYLKD